LCISATGLTKPKPAPYRIKGWYADFECPRRWTANEGQDIVLPQGQVIEGAPHYRTTVVCIEKTGEVWRWSVVYDRVRK